MSHPATPKKDPLVDACINTLSSLGPTVKADLEPGARLLLRLHFQRGAKPEIFHVRIARTHLSHALASGLIDEARRIPSNWILFAPYVPAKIGHHLAQHELSYADTVGNCHIQVHDVGLIAHVEGKKFGRRPQQTGRLPSHLATLAVLIKPTLLNESVRVLAAAAGIGKTAAAQHVRRLADLGFVERARGETRLVRYRELLDRWLTAYAETVRPAWLVGRYSAKTTDPPSLEKQIAEACADRTWALGGGAAAWRMTQFYRGPDTVLHLQDSPAKVLQALRAIPASGGSLAILRTPGTLAYAGVNPNLTHPVLVYSEMVSSSDPRMLEAASEIRQRFIPDA